MSDDPATTLAAVLTETLQLDATRLSDSDSAATVEQWNSMTHMDLMTRLEAAFGVRFALTDVIRVKTLGDLKALLGKHGVRFHTDDPIAS